jgi:multiple sugar transport system substrate-binding protein
LSGKSNKQKPFKKEALMKITNFTNGMFGSKRISRRDFLKKSAMGAAGFAAANTVGFKFPSTATAKKPLTYAFWPWGSEIVSGNAKIFEEQYGEKVNLQPIPGEYAAVLETKLAAKAPIDIFRAQRGQAARWYAAGWIRPIDGMPDLEKIKSEAFPGIVEDAKAPDGKMIGLTYYNGGPFCLFRNEKVLSAAGFEATANLGDYPQTWDEVYEQAKVIKKKKIVEHPLLPCWFKAWTGVPWAFIAHAFSEGEYLVGEDLKAIFSTETPILKMLSDWQKWWDEDLVPRSILTLQETQMSSSWHKGLHAFHPWTDYQSFTYADPKESSIAEYNSQNPVMPGATHDTVLVGHALLGMSTIKRSEEDLMRVWKLMKFYGWRDKTGDLLVKKRWAREANLPQPFPEVYKDPEVKEAIMKWMYPPLAEEQYKWLFDGRMRAKGPYCLKAPWWQEWEVIMHDMISQEMFVKGSKKPKEVVVELKKLWDKMYDKYM